MNNAYENNKLLNMHAIFILHLNME